MASIDSDSQIIHSDDNAQDTQGSKVIRVATWNMDHWRRKVRQREDAWSYLLNGDLADIVLLQETVPPADLDRDRHAYREIGGNRAWGTAVVSFDKEISVSEIGTVRSKYSPTKFSMLGTYPGSILVTKVMMPDVGPITFVSVYGLINVYSQTTMLRVVADLIPLFDSPDGQRVILGGDFNITTATNPKDLEYPRYLAIFNAIESLGLVNVAETAKQKAPSIQGCLCGQGTCSHLRTYGDVPGTQLDWLYATPELANRCRLVHVENELTQEWSDHFPLIAEFDLPVDDLNRQWEPETIIKEIGIRHGKEAQDVSAELVAWALRKHEELARSFSAAGLNRLPTSSGNDPELWVQLDMKRPDRLQYTFSVNAEGNVVIQFQHMSGPYDNEKAKAVLCRRINAISGIDLEERLNGRPKIPLASLAAAEALSEFTGIFDEMIDRSIEEHLKLRENGYVN